MRPYFVYIYIYTYDATTSAAIRAAGRAPAQLTAAERDAMLSTLSMNAMTTAAAVMLAAAAALVPLAAADGPWWGLGKVTPKGPKYVQTWDMAKSTGIMIWYVRLPPAVATAAATSGAARRAPSQRA
jgi:hypothetical protein